MSSGESHTCGVETYGTVTCWGDDQFGQSSPEGMLSAGEDHNCLLETNGTVFCWGDDDYGQSSPPAGTFRQVSAGWYHTCGVEADGTVACWGRNNFGQAPQCNPMSRCTIALPWLMLLLD